MFGLVVRMWCWRRWLGGRRRGCGEKQVPFGNDSQKNKCDDNSRSLRDDNQKNKCDGNSRSLRDDNQKNKGNRRFPSGMTKQKTKETKVQQRSK